VLASVSGTATIGASLVPVMLTVSVDGVEVMPSVEA